MSIKIHHGPPGSYKTAGAMQDDCIKAAREGRHIVLNVRGSGDVDTWHRVLGDLPEEFDLTFVDTSTTAGREHYRRWFHWAPKGALIVLDEINTIYTKGWGLRDFAEYDYPGGLDQAVKDNRPPNVLEAFEMHRHYGWDIVGTSPAWNKVHAVLQDCAEGGYRHHNRKMVGLAGYLEIFHLADNAGRAKSDEITVIKKSIDRRTFALYKSTTTGEVRDTIAGQNVFLRAGPILVFCCIVSLIVGLVVVGPPKALRTAFGSEEVSNVLPGNSKDVADGKGGVVGSGVESADSAGGGAAGFKFAGASAAGTGNRVSAVHHWLDDYQAVYYVGEIANHNLVYVGTNLDDGNTYDDAELRGLEVIVFRMGRCSARLWYGGRGRLIGCRPADRERHNLADNVAARVVGE